MVIDLEGMRRNRMDEPNSAAFLEGYWDGLQYGENLNPYVELSPEWTEYEIGWEEGWLDD